MNDIDSLRMARQLLAMARSLVAADPEEKTDREKEKEIEREVSIGDMARNPEAAVEKVSEILQDPEFDKLADEIRKASLEYRSRRMVVARKRTEDLGKQRTETEIEDDFNSGAMTEKNITFKDDRPDKIYVRNDENGKVFEYDLKDFIEFRGDRPCASDDELEDILYNYFDKAKKDIRAKITRHIMEHPELMNEFRRKKEDIIRDIEEKHSGLIERLKKIGKWAKSNILYVGAAASLVMLLLTATGIMKMPNWMAILRDLSILCGLPKTLCDWCSNASRLTDNASA